MVIAAGFIFPSWMLVGAIVNGWDPIWQFLILVVAGGAQGFLLGFAQWALLAKSGITAPLLPWLAFMTGGPALAWIVVQAPGFLPADTAPEVRLPLVVAGIALAFAVVIFAQWWVLKTVVAHAWKFAVVSLLGWFLAAGVMGGVLFILVGVTDVKLTIAVLIVGAVAAVMIAAAGTWLAARAMGGEKLIRRRTAKKKV